MVFQSDYSSNQEKVLKTEWGTYILLYSVESTPKIEEYLCVEDKNSALVLVLVSVSRTRHFLEHHSGTVDLMNGWMERRVNSAIHSVGFNENGSHSCWDCLGRLEKLFLCWRNYVIGGTLKFQKSMPFQLAVSAL